MGKKKYLTGRAVHPDEPNWEPLRKVGGEWLLANFMAMFEVELETGVRLCAYKHIDTRRYVHLDPDGNAFQYVSAGAHQGAYKKWPFWEAFDQAIRDADFEMGWISRARLDLEDDEEDEAGYDNGRPWPLNRFVRGFVTTSE
jgi:hypothetical protein